MTVALLMSLCLLAPGKKSPVAPPPPPDPSVLRLGIWMELGPGRDSVAARSWANRLSRILDSKVRQRPSLQRVLLDRVVFVPTTSLPLAGGDPHHHPDLRATNLDLIWGVVRTDSLSDGLLESVARTLLTARGCLDERGFAVGWDLFQLPSFVDNKLSSSRFPVDSRNMVRWPPWSIISDSLMPLSCLRALQRHPAGGGPLFSDLNRLEQETSKALEQPLRARAIDALGHPASGARLELWRGVPDSRRPFAALLEGSPRVYVANDSGEFGLASPLAWLADTSSWVHGRKGSRGVTYWRLRHSHRELSGWMDASELLGLEQVRDTLRITWTLPAGSSRSWREASDHWPAPWLAAEVDSSGIVTLGLSVPVATDYVLRVVDERGREFTRSYPMSFESGLYEKRLERPIAPGTWDIRLDAPSSRLQVRVLAR